MAWCEANGVDYVFGLARNERLRRRHRRRRWPRPSAELATTAGRSAASRTFAYAHARQLEPRTPGGRQGRASGQGPEPALHRDLATRQAIDARTLYEDVYCGRGEVENRIKEQQLDLFADRTSAATMRANQLRLWLASFAYVLLEALRRIGLRHTQFATATCGTIRLKLLKIGAQVRKSVRRIKVAMASACPYQAEDHLAYLYLKRARLLNASGIPNPRPHRAPAGARPAIRRWRRPRSACVTRCPRPTSPAQNLTSLPGLRNPG